jgi:hypothetical protein
MASVGLTDSRPQRNLRGTAFASPPPVSKSLHRVAEIARSWGQRGDLSENDRGFAREVGELAAFLSHRPFPHQDDVSSLRILACRLCQRVGAVECHEQQSSCSLGFAEAEAH